MAESEHWDETMSERRLSDGRLLPAEFNDEEATLAATLNEAFNLEAEHLPPEYAQTLLSDGRFDPVDDGYEARIMHRVFQCLELPLSDRERRAATSPRCRQAIDPPIRRYHGRQRGRANRRPSVDLGPAARRAILVALATVALFALNAVTSGAAFASMIRLFVGNGGAQLVASYPTAVGSQAAVPVNTTHAIQINPVWPGEQAQGYTFQGVDVYAGQWWSNGPLVSFRYQKTDQDGAHRLTILEFMPRNQDALQVVQDGSVSNVPVGAANAIFVAGHWMHTKNGPVWSYTDRAELICGDIGEPGLVIWIAADDLKTFDKATVQKMLRQIAQSLTHWNLSDLQPAPDSIRYVGDLQTANGSFGNDVIALVPDGSSGSSPAIYIKIAADSQGIGSDQPPSTNPRF